MHNLFFNKIIKINYELISMMKLDFQYIVVVNNLKKYSFRFDKRKLNKIFLIIFKNMANYVKI